ncbi:hypothetical protein ASPWEDRAFT_103557 [Aspergillus wentii DTO 134E9]|uniref:DUF1275 domain protein n=1 Tax=Aspergillus wentii DTO 134E9 TaxID=1073089 RepID=A0A1L9RYE5_ASPWE|nr:uncharacterized protein ASPWEDRAFT_103557 [Aspergillus wentii DTO 134E9]KAI9931408.1 hypothetical protein MW887_009983 [Aspergillus wentii]OJJ39923.1 hypothetical protein ASPWEDRAFT_103557 [Aspergillus wentii DTO 134E9]
MSDQRSHCHPREYLHQTLTTKHGDLILLLCYLITGLLDSSSILLWGSFVSMQTGNTVYLGLGLAGAESQRWVKSGLSIASFCIGSLVFGWFYRFFSPRKRWVLCVSFAVQMVCIIVAAVIVTLRPTQDNTDKDISFLPLALVAFQSSGQAVSSGVLGFKGLPSVVLTSIFCEFMASPLFLTRKMWSSFEERRRLAAILSLTIGTVAGGLWARSPAGVAGALWTAAIIKGGIIVAWMGWREERITL